MDFLQFQRTYVVGGVDTYSVTFSDPTRLDGPFSETMTDTVTAVNNGVATMNVVTSNGIHSPKGRPVATTEFNSQMQTTFGANGIPTVPIFPSLNVRDALFLAMQGLSSIDVRVGVATQFAAITAPGSSLATFRGQSARAPRSFSVNGTVVSSAGTQLEQLACTFEYRPNAVVSQADLTITKGAQTYTAKFVRTGP